MIFKWYSCQFIKNNILISFKWHFQADVVDFNNSEPGEWPIPVRRSAIFHAPVDMNWTTKIMGAQLYFNDHYIIIKLTQNVKLEMMSMLEYFLHFLSCQKYLLFRCYNCRFKLLCLYDDIIFLLTLSLVQMYLERITGLAYYGNCHSAWF